MSNSTERASLDETIKNICTHHRRTKRSATERQPTRKQIYTAMQPLIDRGVDVVTIGVRLMEVWGALLMPWIERVTAKGIAEKREKLPSLRQVGIKGRKCFDAEDLTILDAALKKTKLFRKHAALDWQKRFYRENLASYYKATRPAGTSAEKVYEATGVRSLLTMVLLKCSEHKEEWARLLAATFPRKWRSPEQVKQDIKNAATRHAR